MRIAGCIRDSFSELLSLNLTSILICVVASYAKKLQKEYYILCYEPFQEVIKAK